MVLLGGKGTLWGPVVGAVVFHVIKEVTWTYFLGWQFVALGLLIVIIVVYFQQGIVGWLMEKYPERFGVQVAPKEREVGARATWTLRRIRKARNERRHHRDSRTSASRSAAWSPIAAYR